MDINDYDFGVNIRIRQDSFAVDMDGDYELLQGSTRLFAGILARLLMVFESTTPQNVRVETIKELLGFLASALMQVNEESVHMVEMPTQKINDFILLDPKKASILN